MKIRNIAIMAIAGLAMASCSTPKNVVYFQDAKAGQEIMLTNLSTIKIRPDDKLSIIVSTPDQRLTDQFNLQMGQAATAAATSDNTPGYIVDSKGDIDFPMLGTIHLSGLTREEAASKIKNALTERNYVKNPVVIVQFMNLNVTVMGSVANPGRKGIKKDTYTVLDALADAGDLTIEGKRDNVLVMREEGGKQKIYAIDLTDAKNVYGSPVYYLQQDDVVYVAPNDKAVRNSTANGNTLQTYGFWMSLATFLISVGVILK